MSLENPNHIAPTINFSRLKAQAIWNNWISIWVGFSRLVTTGFRAPQRNL